MQQLVEVLEKDQAGGRRTSLQPEKGVVVESVSLVKVFRVVVIVVFVVSVDVVVVVVIISVVDVVVVDFVDVDVVVDFVVDVVGFAGEEGEGEVTVEVGVVRGGVAGKEEENGVVGGQAVMQVVHDINHPPLVKEAEVAGHGSVAEQQQ